MLEKLILIFFIFLIQDAAILESASSSKRVVFQTFSSDFFVTCYGTCAPSKDGFTSAIENLHCEGDKIRLKCEENHVIKISFAFYGKLWAGKKLCSDVSAVLEQCRKDVTDIVSKDCDGKGRCVFTVDEKRFAKYCQATYFYLDVRHTCEYKPSTIRKPVLPSTTRRTTTTRTRTTPRRTTRLKPITIYKDKKETSSKDLGNTDRSTAISQRKTNKQGTTTNKFNPNGKSTKTVTTEGSGSHGTSSQGTETTHSPISRSSSSTKVTKGAKNVPVPKINTSIATSLGRSANKKGSLYWFLTAYSLVTDKSFIKANSTHMVLAIILALFIALVLSTCFVLDHCRRVKRRNALKGLQEAESLTLNCENGPPQPPNSGTLRPKNRSRSNSVVTNGRPKHNSLEEVNHNGNNERLPLIPLTASLGDIGAERFTETSFIRTSTMDMLPPPPAELLADTPQDKGGFLDDNQSDTSTISIPPPDGFGDSDKEELRVKIQNFTPEVIITSPTPTNSSVSSSHAILPYPGKSLQSVPKIDNSQRLNNEFYSASATLPRDGNLLQNHVSVQTNDLRDGGFDKPMKLENPGHMSMRSPNYEVSDIYATTDKVSNIGILDLEAFETHESRGILNFAGSDDNEGKRANGWALPPPGFSDSFGEGLNNETDLGSTMPGNSKCGDQNAQNTKRGRLLVIKSPNTAEDRERKTHSCKNASFSMPENSHQTITGCRNEEDCSFESKDVITEKKDSIGKSLGPGDDREIPNGTCIKNTPKVTSTQSRPDTDSKSDRPPSESSSCSSYADSECTLNMQGHNGKAKQIFAVPKHRCGMGHKHPCVCIPLRTGSSSFICSCLEKAKNKSSKCCMEKCPDVQQSNQGAPYSSQRSPREKGNERDRGAATEVLKRKNYNNTKRSSSLEDISKRPPDRPNLSPTAITKDHRKLSKTMSDSAASPVANGRSDLRSKTLPILQSKLKKKAANGGSTDCRELVNMKRNEPKLIPVIVHSSGSTGRGRLKPRFEKAPGNGQMSSSGSQSKIPPTTRSEDSDSSDRSDSTEGGHSKSLPSSPTGKRRFRNGNVRLSPICENNSKRPPILNTTGTKTLPRTLPKKSPRFKIQVVESVHYDKRQQFNEV